MLLLGAAALSKYALSGILTTIDHSYLQANIVQVVDESGKSYPSELNTVLQLASPSLLLVTPAEVSSKGSKSVTTSAIVPPPFINEPWQVIQTAQAGTTEIDSNTNGWNIITE